MTARNETIIVNRQDKDGDLTWDAYRACRWETVPRPAGRALLVYAWRRGVAVVVAEYEPGQWTFVQRQREIT